MICETNCQFEGTQNDDEGMVNTKLVRKYNIIIYKGSISKNHKMCVALSDCQP